jgi:hypothetical protein
MMSLRRRFTLAAGAAALALLALPSLAGARPGTAPGLVQRSGRLVVLHADRPDGTSTRQWMLVSGERHVAVRLPDDTWVEPGTPVQVEGTMQNGALVLADSVTAVRQEGASAPAADPPAIAAAPALHSTVVILVGFGGGPARTAADPTVPDATSLMFDGARPDSLTSYYQEQTYGQIAFGNSGVSAVTISSPTATCTNDDIYNWAALAEHEAGVNDQIYQHYVFVFPHIAACSWTGQAEIGGRYVWINGAFQPYVLAHELGHNLGLAHAGGLLCQSGGAAVAISSTCDPAGLHPYGDPFDAMGRAPVLRQMSMQHKLKLHLLPSSAVKVVGASGTYRLAPMETLTGAPEVLRIPKPGGGNYYVEYRSPIGFFDSQAPVLQGVLIRTEAPVSDPNDPDTALIDMHPGTPGNWNDAAMDVGQVFSDPLSNVTIQNVGQDASGAALLLNVPLDTIPPSAPSGLSAVAADTSAVLHWTAANDDYSVDYYRVTRDGVLVGVPTAADFTDTGLVPGTAVTYAVAAVDAGGNIGPAIAARLTIPDAAPPSAPARVTVVLTRDGRAHLTWSAATDNGRVASYRVRRNGKPIASGLGLAYVDRAARPGRGSAVTYSIVAVDLAGNVGPAGKARAVRAALLRKLRASGLQVARFRVGKRTLLRVTGRLSDAEARCRLRVGAGVWHACRPKASGAFATSLPAAGSAPVTLSLRDALGRVKLQTLRVR